MRKLTTLTSLTLVLSVTAAYADGLSLKDGPPIMWAGLYLGGTVGYGWGSSETYYNNDGEFTPDGDHP